MEKISKIFTKIIFVAIMGICLLGIISKVQAVKSTENTISLNKTYITTKKARKEQLIAYDNDGKEISKFDIEWSSSDTKIVKVSYGEIQTYNEGTATITAMCKKTSAKATCVVKVERVEQKNETETTVKPEPSKTPTKVQDTELESAISLNKTSITTKKARKEQLIAYDDDGNEISKFDIEWSSSDTKIVKVSYGELQTYNEGTATIIAKCKRTGAKAICLVEVKKSEQKEDTTPEPSNPTTSAGEDEYHELEENKDLDKNESEDMKEISKTSSTNKGITTGLISIITEIVKQIINIVMKIVNIGINTIF